MLSLKKVGKLAFSPSSPGQCPHWMRSDEELRKNNKEEGVLGLLFKFVFDIKNLIRDTNFDFTVFQRNILY